MPQSDTAYGVVEVLFVIAMALLARGSDVEAFILL